MSVEALDGLGVEDVREVERHLHDPRDRTVGAQKTATASEELSIGRGLGDH